jgi:hypothetical protein
VVETILSPLLPHPPPRGTFAYPTVMFSARKVLANTASKATAARWASTAASKDKYKIVVVGAGVYVLTCTYDQLVQRLFLGAAGLTVANQIYYRFQKAGKSLNNDDIVILDSADYHHYQVRGMHLLAFVNAYLIFLSSRGGE